MASLLDDYIGGKAGLLANYAGWPSEVGAHPVQPRPWDPGLAAAMDDYQRAIGGTGTFRGDETAIVTGQQPGIFTGPLYTIYKAITAINLASAVARATGTPTVPIYWVGGDDHDYDEIRRVHLLSRHHHAVPLELEKPDKDGQSAFRMPVPPALHELVDEAARQAPGSEFTEEVQSFLHESLDAAANLSEWHARLMARLFQDTPLLFFTPDLPAAREAATPVFEREIRTPLASTAYLNEGGGRLESAGYGAQVVKSDDSCNFFLESQGMRCRVRYADGQFNLPDTGEAFSEADLLALLKREPGRFTANVALRCIVQQHLFPTRAYVAGPGELAYWGQLKGVFEHFEHPMPIVYPRSRCVLTSLKTNKLLRKYGLSFGDMNGAAVDLEERALRAAQQDPAMSALERNRVALSATVAAMEKDFQVMGRAGKAAAELAAQFSEQVQQGLDHMERSLLRADEDRTVAIRNQIARLTAELAPERKPQERYYTIFSWMFQQGWGLVPRLVEKLDHTRFGLQEVEL